MFSLTPGRARIGGRPVLPDPVGVSGITMIGNDLLIAITMKSLIISVRVRTQRDAWKSFHAGSRLRQVGLP